MRASREHWRTSGHRNRSIQRLAVGLLVLGLAYHALTFAVNHDVAWWLFVAESMMEGETLYRDLIEINPPLYGYLSMIPVVIARFLGFETLEIVKPYYLISFMFLAAWSASLLKLDFHDRYDGPLAVALLVLILIGLPGVDFAQREHVMLALFLPYLFMQTQRRLGSEVSPPLAAGVGVAAGIGIALKPHFVLILMLVELTLWLRIPRKNKWLLRPELWFSAIILGGYGAFVLLAYPEYVRLLIDARHLYTEFSSKPVGTLLLRPAGLLLLATAVFSWFHRHADTQRQQYVQCLLVFAFAAWLVALIQAKGWAYHFYPTLAATTLAATLLIFDEVTQFIESESQPRRARRVGTLLFGGVVVALLSLTIGGQIAYDGLRASAFEAQVRYLDEQNTKSLVIMSPRVPDSFPAVHVVNAEWASPFPHLWWLQAAHGDDPGSSTEPPVPKDSVEIAFRGQLIDRMSRMEPDLVLVDTAESARFSGGSFPYLAYMSEDARFRQFWEQYERSGAILHFRVFSRRQQPDD